MFGSGYVGLVTSACFADSGHKVCCFDIDIEKITNLKRGDIDIYEPGLKKMVLRNQKDKRLEFSSSSTKAINPESLEDNIINNHRIIHCNGRHLDACMQAAEITKKYKEETLLSFDGGAGRYRKELLPLMERINIAIVAKDFALKATNETKLNQSTWIKLNQLFPKAYIIGITDGHRGSWIQYENQEPFHQSAFLATNIEDTTGCGDVYHGTFLHAIESGTSVNEAARMASGAGSMNATALGGRGLLPTKEQLNKFLDKAKEIQSS